MKSNRKRILFAAFLISMAFVLSSCGFIYHDISYDIKDYHKYYAGKSAPAKSHWIPNDIFPERIPASAKAEDFCYYFYDPWDENYLGYLVFMCGEDDFRDEIKRLSSIQSSKDYLIYGATKFNYPVLAVHADDYYGYVYALADEENRRLIYTELTFCNYFTDIDYQKIIDRKYLPEGFDASYDNATAASYLKED